MDASNAVQFGVLLRQARKRKGWSQAELAGDKYTGSYISHLESGRRAATPEVIEFLCRQLGVPPEEWGLVPGGQAVAQPSSAMEDLLLAERAWSERDWAAAIKHATRAVEIAERSHDQGRHWEALYVLAQANFASGNFAEAADLAEQLAEHETGGRLPVARAQALSLASFAHRSADRLGWAVAFAARAVEAASAAPPVVLSDALMALVSAMTEAGHSPAESRPYLDRLAAVEPELSSDHAKGMVEWTLGTAAIVAGEPASGVGHFERALSLLDSRRDVRLWLRLQRSFAEAKVDAGLLDGVAQMLQNASVGLSLVGNKHDLAELRQAEAKLALATGEPERAVELMEAVLADPVLGAPDVSHGFTRLVLANAYSALNKVGPAREQYAAAAIALENEGRLRTALRAWRQASELEEIVD
jgi:Helix-turn-helix.